MPKYNVEIQSRDKRRFHDLMTQLECQYQQTTEDNPRYGIEKYQVYLEEEDAFTVRFTLKTSVVKLVPEDGKPNTRKEREDKHRVSIKIGADGIGKIETSNPVLASKISLDSNTSEE